MSFFIWTVLVGIVGWGASLAMRSAEPNRHMLHALIGVSGALVGAWLMAVPARGSVVQAADISVLSLLVSFFIALALSMIANLWARVSAQEDVETDF